MMTRTRTVCAFRRKTYCWYAVCADDVEFPQFKIIFFIINELQVAEVSAGKLLKSSNAALLTVV